MKRLGLCSSGIIALLLCFSILSGCGDRKESDFHVFLRDANGLTTDSEARWRGVAVGHVTRVDLEQGQVRVDVELYPQYRSRLRQDVKARASRGFLGQGRPALELFGGSNPDAPPLPQGATVREAGVIETFPYKSAAVAGGVVVLVILVALLLKGIRKLIALLLAIALLAAAAWFFATQWGKYHQEFVSPDLEARITAKAHEILGSPEAQAAWESIRGDLADALEKAKEHGSVAAQKAKEKLNAALDAKVEELKEKGKDASVEDILKLKQQLDGILESSDK